MNRKDMLEAVAPCGLLCHTCFGFRKSAVRDYAAKLRTLYSGWLEGHERVYGDNPTPAQSAKLERIRIFQEELEALGNPARECEGCRATEGRGCGSIPGCQVPGCTKAHEVEFCGECPEFPCAKNDGIFAPNVLKKWLQAGKRIQEIGAEEYFEESRMVPHYGEFCRNEKATENDN